MKNIEHSQIIEFPRAAEPSDSISYTIYDNSTILISEQALLSYIFNASSSLMSVTNIINSQGTLINNEDGSWHFIPPKYVTENVVLVFSVFDGEKHSDHMLYIQLPNSKKIPVISLLNMKTNQDGSFDISAQQMLKTATDIDGSNLRVIQVATHQGQISSDDNLMWHFIPAQGFDGRFELQFTVTDGQVSVPEYVIIDTLH